MKSLINTALSLTTIIVVFTSCDSNSLSLTKNNKIKTENQPKKISIQDNEPGYCIITNKKLLSNAAYTGNVFSRNTVSCKTNGQEKAPIEKFTDQQNEIPAAVPIVNQGRSYQQTASEKIYEDDTVKRRQVHGIEKITAEKTSTLPGEKGMWHAVQTNENNVVTSLYKEKGKDIGGGTKNSTDIPDGTSPIVEVDILQAGLNVVNSDRGLALASLHLFEINQQGDSSSLTKNNSFPGEFPVATPTNAAMITSSKTSNALYTGELNIEIVRADIWAIQQKNSLAGNESQNNNSNPGNAEPPKNLSASELEEAYESLRTILNDYDLPETKEAWQKICADIKRGKEHYVVNITGQISAPAE